MIELTDLRSEVIRDQKSSDFRVDPNYIYQGNGYDKPFTNPDFQNNVKNNMLDIYRLWFREKLIFECPVQTYANYPLSHTRDTIAPGVYQETIFVDQRKYMNKINGIRNCLDMEGQLYNPNSMQWDMDHEKGRALSHGNAYFNKKLNKWTYPIHSWSMACFVKLEKDQVELNKVFVNCGINKDNFFVINGLLSMKRANVQ